MDTILTIKNLSKTYGKIQAVKNLNLTINKGNIYGILGPNGSGKSTTLGIILNVVNKTAGEYQWFDGKLQNFEALKKVGAIIERPNFYPYMSAYENLELVCKIKKINTQKIDEKLQLVGLYDRKDSDFRTFSLGMKQRLAIASALLNDPEILILDEPTNGLDPSGIHQIRDIITTIAKTGTTILLASHLLDEVEKVCTHVMIMRKGEMLHFGSVSDLNSSQQTFEIGAENLELLSKVISENFPTNTIEDQNQFLKITFKENIQASDLNKKLHENGIILNHLVTKKQTLEELFLKITQN